MDQLVIQTFVEVLKQFARPTSVTFFIGLLGVGVALAFTGRRSGWRGGISSHS
jgi:hypothetical protein